MRQALKYRSHRQTNSLFCQVFCSKIFPAFGSGRGKGTCWGAFTGPLTPWSVCLGRSADGDHRDPSVRASCRPGILPGEGGPAGRLRENSGSFCFKETYPTEPGKNPEPDSPGFIALMVHLTIQPC